MKELLLLLLPLAALSGWYAAKRSIKKQKHESEQFPRGYLLGLNYLLNEQPDKAVDVFIKMLEVDSETVETHLALGVLFRRRGEVARAIRIHQNLIARPQLPKQQRIEALLALGQDYLRAGVFDRAERLFLEVSEQGDEYATLAMHLLLDVYQQQKRWEAAIPVAHKLFVNDTSIASYIAHYYCELAVGAQKQKQQKLARRYLEQALEIDKRCVRASLLKGEIEEGEGDFKVAIESYKQVKNQDVDYFSEAIGPIIKCYKHLAEEEELLCYLQDSLKEHPRISIVSAIAEHLQNHHGIQTAITFITEQLHQRPSLRGLRRLIALQLETAQSSAREYLSVLQEVAERLLKNRPIYRCVHCGFGSKLLLWLCPSCKNWNTVRPIQGLEGD